MSNYVLQDNTLQKFQKVLKYNLIIIVLIYYLHNLLTQNGIGMDRIWHKKCKNPTPPNIFLVDWVMSLSKPTTPLKIDKLIYR